MKQPLLLGHLVLQLFFIVHVMLVRAAAVSAVWLPCSPAQAMTSLMMCLLSHRTLSSLNPRIPRIRSSPSSVCAEVMGRGAVQVGTALMEESSAWHNGSEPSDLKMETARCSETPE